MKINIFIVTKVRMDEMKLIEDKKNILLCDKILILKKEPLPYCILCLEPNFSFCLKAFLKVLPVLF